MDLLDRLLEHDQWATTQLLDLCRDLSDEQLDQPFDIGHRTLRETWNHMLFNVAFWTGLMIEQPVDPARYREDYDASMPGQIERAKRTYETFTTAARRARDEQRLDDTFIDHFDGPMTYGGAILHLALHNEGHRTEILHILERLGLTDLPEIDHALWDYKRRGF